ncbi:MAG: tRNA-Ile-lysidine synthase [Betaproteobacteria bacterium]|nr:tRNA-Ile-lysidine synthase [Betaproteobacteria bacterium]
MRESLRTAAAQLGRSPVFCAGFSGGLDSTVLLDLLAPLCKQEGHALRALHVHHGLSPNADAWERHCAAVCAALRVPLQVAHVVVNRAPRTSLEEEARRARHAAFADVSADVIVLAHHADDQAETVLLQLLRGAGPKGLAGMPPLKSLGPGAATWLQRPLLDFPRTDLLDYAQVRGLQWIEDESNQDDRLKRNFLRNQVAPLLRAGFPAPAQTLARAARHQAEAAQLLDALADLDLAQAAAGAATEVQTLEVAVLVVETLKQHDDTRLKNALRRWLDRAGLRQPSAARLGALLRALRESSNDTRLRWEHEGACVARQKGLLCLELAASGPI